MCGMEYEVLSLRKKEIALFVTNGGFMEMVI